MLIFNQIISSLPQKCTRLKIITKNWLAFLFSDRYKYSYV